MKVASKSDHLCCVFLQANYTALHSAADNGSNNVIFLLLSNGAKVNAVTIVS